MRPTAAEIENGIDELLIVLDRDIQHIQKNLSRLNKLRTLVVKRDDTALGELLENIQSESESYKNHELRRRTIRKELASALGCSPEQMTLSRLEASLSGPKKVQLAERRSKLRLLIEELKKEHLNTTMLLSECARFNSVLLRGILEVGKTGTITYNSKGSAKRQTDTAFVTLQF